MARTNAPRHYHVDRISDMASQADRLPLELDRLAPISVQTLAVLSAESEPESPVMLALIDEEIRRGRSLDPL